MTTPVLSCSNCLLWEEITQEGSSGTPMKPARPDFGVCHLHNLAIIRVKGFLETHKDFYCRGYVELGKYARAVPASRQEEVQS